jgi:DNA repair protein RecN (Recombination protein N)
MLQLLTIQNFILIKELQFKPGQGLSVITGETGAGKSILLDALELILGGRADSSMLFQQDKKCILEAVFNIKTMQLQTFFEAHELDYADETILRREINAGGKSRAFVNDTPVSLQILRNLGEHLIEIHTQHTGLLITSAAEQLKIVDDFANEPALWKEYAIAWDKYIAAEKELNHLKVVAAEAQKERDFNQFQFEELAEFSPVANEEINLEIQSQTLSHAEEINNAAANAAYLLNETENSIADQIVAVKSSLKQAANHHPQIAEILTRLESQAMELKDIAQSLEIVSVSIENDAGKLQRVNERISKLQHLLKKHNLHTASDLIMLMEKLETKLEFAEKSTTRLENLARVVAEARSKALELAKSLHKMRLSAAEKLCRQAEKQLKDLGMPFAQLKADIQLEPDKMNQNGASTIRLLFSANSGQALQALDKVASGGEVSRLNFCFKSLLAGKKSMPTLIFDEADSGVSGEVAGKMGLMMQRLGEKHQVISITHLPQVAAAGQTHFFVYKSSENGATTTGIRVLSGADRVSQIAQMLSGNKPGEAAVANARELLGAV